MIYFSGLTHPGSIMDYFSEVIHHPVAERLDERMQEEQSEFVTPEELRAREERLVKIGSA